VSMILKGQIIEFNVEGYRFRKVEDQEPSFRKET